MGCAVLQSATASDALSTAVLMADGPELESLAEAAFEFLAIGDVDRGAEHALGPAVCAA